MKYNVGNTVKVNKNIYRVSYDIIPSGHVLYASEGETGVIVEIFRPTPTGGGEVKALCAKVKIQDKIKTFRLTSLDIVE